MPHAFHSHLLLSLCLLFLCKDELTDLKLVIEDTIDNVATLQDCSVDHVETRTSTREALQLLGENRLQLAA